MEIYPFITYLRQLMIGKASSTELKNQLDRDLSELKLHTERIKYLEEIIKLWRGRDLENMNRGEIPDFLHYIEFKYEVEKNVKNPIKDWSWLFNKLINRYIKDISSDDFNEVMTYKRLPNGKLKTRWFGLKSEATYFQEYFKFSMKQFNECFIFKDDTSFAKKNRLNTNPEESFIVLLKT